MSTLETSLRRIIQAVAFQSADSFSFAGRHSAAWGVPPAPAVKYGQGASAGQNPAVQALQNVLYGVCYTRNFTGVLEDLPTNAGGDDRNWVESLSAANGTKERWEEGWKVQQFLPSGQVYAQKGALTRAFWPGEFISRGSYGVAPQPGTSIAVFLARESRKMQPGFYFAFGETQAAMEDEFPTVRFYWNVKQDGAAPLIRALTTSLNRYQVPYRFKIVNQLAFLGRSDAALLYVGRRYYRIAADISREAHAKVAAGLSEAVPLFTLPLAKGLAFAEDPGNQESFGMSRCRMVAEGLWLAFSEGRATTEDRIERIRQHFAASGTSLERPHLNLASIDTYEFPQ